MGSLVCSELGGKALKIVEHSGWHGRCGMWGGGGSLVCSEQRGKALNILEHSEWYGRCGMWGWGPWYVVSWEGKH